ncbi:MAG: MMPL family transporter [Candidatus Heimdallarchaeota archaeon]
MCKIKLKNEKLELENKIASESLEKKKDNKDKTPKKKRKKEFFKWFGGFVTRRYKIILIVSLLSLASAIYPAYLLQGELKYNDQDFLPQNLESNIGVEILEDQFDSNISRQSTIIVLDSDELISSEDNLAYIEALTQGIIDSNITDDVARVDNIVSTFNEYNSTYWSEINQTQAVIDDMLVNNLTYANVAIHQAAEELNTTMKQIAGLYLMTWFNFSRTYYYGHYDSNLFSVGPLDPTVLQTIALDTNFTTGFAIAPEYVSLVFSYANSLGNHAFVNDVVVNEFALNIANMSLFYASNLTLEEYQEQLYPLLDMYHQYWKQSFQQIITTPGVSIVNGTLLSENLYDNSTIPNAYVSQGTTLGYLQMVNNSAFQNIDIKNMILSQASEFFDLSDPQIMAFLSSEYLETIIEAVYDLGPNPSQLAIQALSTSITEQIIQGIILANPSIPTMEEFCISPQVSNITRWFLSTDGKCSIYLVSYDVSRYSTIEEKDRALVAADKWIGEYSHQLISDMNLTQTRVYHTGEIFITESITESSGEAAGSVDIFAVVFVVIALLLIFTSLVAPLIPLLTIGIAIVVSFAFLFWISKVMDIHYLSTLILTIISLGAGVDYCIFIYSRYTEELKRGKPKEDAVKIAIEHAGESVFHSGLTVMVGFGALIIPDFPMLRSLGIAMLIGVAFSILASIFIVPSLLMLLGDKVFWPKQLNTILRPQKWFKKKKVPTIETEELSENVPDGQSIHKTKLIEEETDKPKRKDSLSIRIGKFVTKNGLAIFLLAIVSIAPMVYFTTQMKTSTDFMRMMPSDFEPRDASDILTEKMDYGNPISVKLLFTNLDQEVFSEETLIDTENLCLQILSQEHVKTIRTVTRPLGTNSIPFDDPAMYSSYLSIMDDFVGKDNHTFYMEIYLDVDPYSDEANDYVGNLPDFIDEVISQEDLSYLTNADHYVMGVSRTFYEMNLVTTQAYPIVVPIVILGVFLVLLFLFGSYFTPIRLILTIGMSIAFTLGMLYLVYGLGFGAPIFWLLPIMLFSILMGLGLDYDIFLVSRIKEYCQAGMTDKDAIIHALDHTGTIITSCGLVMAAAFSSLMFTELWHINELGFAFTISILLDATVVRLILVPSIMVLLEKLNWKGPKRLQKVHRNPKVTAVMKILGDNIGIEIYSPELKKSLEDIVDQSSSSTTEEELIGNMQPALIQYIDEKKLTTTITNLMTIKLKEMSVKS